MSTKLLAAVMAAGLGFAINGASAQSVNLQGPPIVRQETTVLAQASSEESTQPARHLVAGGTIYEGYTLPGRRDDMLLAARIDETPILAEGEEMNVPYEGYTPPGQRDDMLLAARMDETLILREGEEPRRAEELVAKLSNIGLSQGSAE
jgi:hypothetical protein